LQRFLRREHCDTTAECPGSNAAEDDQATVRPASLAPRTADKRELATPAKPWRDRLALLLRALAERSTRPLVALGSRFTDMAHANSRTTGRSVLPPLVIVNVHCRTCERGPKGTESNG